MTHGVCGYVYHGCRCATCTRAQRDRMRVYRARAKASDRLDTTPGTTEKCPREVAASGGVAPRSTPLKRFEQYPPSGGGA